MKYGSLSRRAVLKTVLSSILLAGCQSAGIRVTSTATSEPPAPTSTGTPTVSPTPSSTPSPTLTPSATPYQPIVSPSRIVAVSAGGAHSLALREDGGVWGWGDPINLGILDYGEEFILTPIELDFLKNIVAIDTDDWHTSLFVDKDGHVFRTGYPEGMEALTQLPIDNVVQAQAEGDTVIARCSDGIVWAYGEPDAGLDGLLGEKELEETGQFVQLPIDNIIDIFVRPSKALFLRQDGKVWVWGQGEGYRFFELLEGEQNPSPRFVDPPELYPDIVDAIDMAIGNGLIIVRSNGVVWEDLSLSIDPPQEFLEDVVQVDGTVSRYSLAVDSSGRLWGWGYGRSGQLAVENRDEYYGTPVRIPIPGRVIAVSAGISHALALDDEGTVWAWGATAFGELGIGETTEEFIYTPIPILYSQ